LTGVLQMPESQLQGWALTDMWMWLETGPEYQDMPHSRMIYPLSPFGLSWLGLTAFFLIYTAVVTPPMIAFHWLDPDCSEVCHHLAL